MNWRFYILVVQERKRCKLLDCYLLYIYIYIISYSIFMWPSWALVSIIMMKYTEVHRFKHCRSSI